MYLIYINIVLKRRSISVYAQEFHSQTELKGSKLEAEEMPL